MTGFAALVHREARLLDGRDYAGWLALFTADCRYWVPADPAMGSPLDGPSHFHDDRQLMQARTHRLLNPRAFGAEPPPATLHFVSGIELLEESEGRAVVASAQLVLEHRERGGFEADQRLFGGRVTHRLRLENGAWRIVEKRIDLVNARASMNAILAPL
jgi:benzoate/toluate 1,2-dioxygenase beta subunit